MHFAIIDAGGTTLDTFREQRGAVAAVLAMIEHDYAAAKDVFLLAYGDDGAPYGEAVRGIEIHARKVRWQGPGTDTARPTDAIIDPPDNAHVQARVRDEAQPLPES